jgi:hypothetical protein
VKPDIEHPTATQTTIADKHFALEKACLESEGYFAAASFIPSYVDPLRLKQHLL